MARDNDLDAVAARICRAQCPWVGKGEIMICNDGCREDRSSMEFEKWRLCAVAARDEIGKQDAR